MWRSFSVLVAPLARGYGQTPLWHARCRFVALRNFVTRLVQGGYNLWHAHLSFVALPECSVASDAFAGGSSQSFSGSIRLVTAYSFV